MNTLDLERVPLIDLLIEMLKQGKAGTIPSLAPFEPIDLADIERELKRRTGKDLGPRFEVWYDWFINECPNATASEREALRLIRSFRERDEHFASRIRSRKKNR
jgi:hypothetical protein